MSEQGGDDIGQSGLGGAGMGRNLAVYLAGHNAATHDREGHPSADPEGHIVSLAVLKRERGDTPMTPVRARISHGVSPQTAASMLRKMADLVEAAPEALSGEPGYQVRRDGDGTLVRRKITIEALLAAADEMEPDMRQRLMEMIDEIRSSIEEDERGEAE